MPKGCPLTSTWCVPKHAYIMHHTVIIHFKEKDLEVIRKMLRKLCLERAQKNQDGGMRVRMPLRMQT